MLESLNGVSARAANDEAETSISTRASASSSDRPVALGAVSLLALNEIGVDEIDGGATANTITTSDTAVDARWLATLQNDAGREIAAD